MKTYRFTEPLIRCLGRSLPGETLPLYWTGSGFELRFTGTALHIEYENRSVATDEWIRVTLNGTTMIRMAVPAGRGHLCLLRNLPEGQTWDVRLYKETQPQPAEEGFSLALHSLSCDGELLPPPARTCRIECLGDSITSGEGLAGPTSLIGWSSNVFSSDGHYMFRAAELLNAEARVVSMSGWGIFCGWDGDRSSNLPSIYEQVCATGGAAVPHDFSLWQPDAVVINLGTNDNGAFNLPQEQKRDDGSFIRMERLPDGRYDPACAELVTQAAADFLCILRRCNPDAWLVWVLGMLGDGLFPIVQQAIDRYRQTTGDEKIRFVPLDDTTPETVGSNNHPGRAVHAAAAEKIAGTVRSLLSDRYQETGNRA